MRRRSASEYSASTSSAVSSLVAVHPHVERRVLRVREAALDPVELQRRDAEVEQDAVDLGNPEAVEGVDDAVVDGVHELRAVAERGEALPGDAEGVEVAVEADDGQLGEALEERLGVTGHAEGGVDEHGAGAADRRGEQLDAALEHDGGVDAFDVHDTACLRASCS